jgi:hypothetical protein
MLAGKQFSRLPTPANGPMRSDRRGGATEGNDMFWANVLFALFIAAIVAALATAGLRRPGPWGSGFWLFLVIFLGTWAVVSWMEPAGPLFWGVAWVPMLLVALLIGLVLAAASPPAVGRRTVTTEEEHAAESVAVAVVGGFFWIVVIALFIAAIAAWF